MSKLQRSKRVVLQPDVPSLIHDVILSLCQRKYADVSDVEVDGIICISFNGLSEQQVIKIHENLPSAQMSTADSDSANKTAVAGNGKNEASQHVHRLNELDLQLEVENVNKVSHEKDNKADETSNSQTEIGNEAESTDSNNYRSDISFLSSLLKNTNDIMEKESTGMKKKGRKPRTVKADTKDKIGSSSRRKRKHPVHHPIRGSPKKAYTDESLTDSRAESNDFSTEPVEPVLPTMVVIKQEPLDSDETNPKIVDVFSASNATGHTGEPVDQSNKDTANNEYQGALNERQNQEFSWQNLGMRRPASEARSLDDHQSKENKDIADEDNMNIVIKQEVVDDEFDNACGENIDHRLNSKGLTTGVEGAHNGEYPDFFHIANYFEKENDNQEIENGSKDSYTALKKSKANDKNESAASKKWFETVKKNMNKYQAALLKSVQITKKGPNVDKGSKPRVGDDRDGDENNLINPEETPVLKSILDTSPTEDISERDTPTDITVKKEASVSESEGQEFGGAKPKLVTKYPALFSQLKKTKQAENQNDMAAQPDSLVNRLPFLSFKDLFAQASPGTSASNIDFRPSPERLASLLSQPSKSNGSQQDQETSNINFIYGTPARRGWNWKKRAVRPKGPNGEILTHLPPMSRAGQKPVGIANPKSRQKPRSKDKDDEWRPHHAEGRVSGSQRAVPKRSSSGRSRRTNFTEYSDSDIEEIEIEQDETDNYFTEMDGDTPIQMVSAYCKNNCGNRFDSIEELSTHEEACSHKGFTCEFCGLDFVQQYRWQYHMIKVHGISVDSAMFR